MKLIVAFVQKLLYDRPWLDNSHFVIRLAQKQYNKNMSNSGLFYLV